MGSAKLIGCDLSDWSMERTNVVFLGAGFSRSVTEGKAPLMHDFFDQLDASKFPKLHGFIAETRSDPTAANVEEVLVELDQVCTSPNRALIRWCDRWKREGRAVREELGRYCYTRLSCLPIHDNWATRLLAGVGHDTTVITTNYDTAGEFILQARPGVSHNLSSPRCHHCRMYRLLREGCGCSDLSLSDSEMWRGSILKLHGSIAWARCINEKCCDNQCILPDRHCRPIYGLNCDQCLNECTPVIVLPSMAKHLDEFQEIGRMWDAAEQALRQARSILIFGFSFPSSDGLIRRLFAQSACRTGKLERIAIVDIDPEAVKRRILAMLPHVGEVTIRCFVAPSQAERSPDWIRPRADAA